MKKRAGLAQKEVSAKAKKLWAAIAEPSARAKKSSATAAEDSAGVKKPSAATAESRFRVHKALFTSRQGFRFGTLTETAGYFDATDSFPIGGCASHRNNYSSQFAVQYTLKAARLLLNNV